MLCQAKSHQVTAKCWSIGSTEIGPITCSFRLDGFFDIASSMVVNMALIQMCQQVLQCAKKLIVRATDIENKNIRVSSKKQAVVQALTVALLPTPTKDNSNDSKKPLISTRALSKMLGFSNGAGWRHISKGLKKCEEISESNTEGWCMIDDDNIPTQYSDTLLNDLEVWMNDNDMVRFNPNKGETILKRDRQGKIVRDPITKKPINLSKLLMTCNPRELHNHMISDFVGATDGDKILISESKIRQILKSSCCHSK